MTSALGYTGWGLFAAGAFVLWVVSHTARGASVARPSVLLTRLATGPWLRIVLVVSWMWAGWHLFAR